jgi:hypothetical protein
MIFQNLFEMLWLIFFEILAFIGPLLPFKNLSFFEAAYCQICPFYFWYLATLFDSVLPENPFYASYWPLLQSTQLRKDARMATNRNRPVNSANCCQNKQWMISDQQTFNFVPVYSETRLQRTARDRPFLFVITGLICVLK